MEQDSGVKAARPSGSDIAPRPDTQHHAQQNAYGSHVFGASVASFVVPAIAPQGPNAAAPGGTNLSNMRPSSSDRKDFCTGDFGSIESTYRGEEVVVGLRDRDPASDETADGGAPRKRRRTGRRSMNPELSAEERRRMRTLKNRESAMRSLQKKAEYASRLEADERRLREGVADLRESLLVTVNTANSARSVLEEKSEHRELLERVDACLRKCRDALALDGSMDGDGGDFQEPSGL